MKSEEKDMQQNGYDKLANKLIDIEDAFSEIQTITGMINIWIKENDYQLIPIMNMLNEKINNVSEIIRK